MTLAMRIWFHILRFMDEMWPGWNAPPAPDEDYLTADSFHLWMTREGRR